MKKLETWQDKTIQENTASKDAQAEIDLAWIKVEKMAGPYELDVLLRTQKKACSELLKIKDELIAEYVGELKAKDDEYVRELKRQTEEIGRYPQFANTVR